MLIGCSMTGAALLRIVGSMPLQHRAGAGRCDNLAGPFRATGHWRFRFRAGKHVAGQESVGDAIHEPLVSGFLPCLSGHALRVNTDARRLGVALLLCPSGLGSSPSRAPSKKARLGTWEPAPLAPGFANG